MLFDGSYRAIKCCALETDSTGIIIVEVGASDGIKILSTEVVCDSDAENRIEQFIQIRKGVISNSIPWPNDIFDSLFGGSVHNRRASP